MPSVTILTRAQNAAPLNNAQLDQNLLNLKAGIEASVALAGDTMTGKLTNSGNDIEIQGANPRLTLTETDASNKKWFVIADGSGFSVRETDTSTSRLTISSGGDASFSNSLSVGGSITVAGNLTINGTMTTVNSTSITVDDPVITLGGDTAPTTDDNKDRGVEFRYFDTAAKTGFMGFQDTTQKFVFLTAATNTNEVFTGTKGTLVADLEGTATKVSTDLVRGSYLTGNNYNGSSSTTWAVDATSANTASKVVARDASGNFSAGTITANLTGTATKVSNALSVGSYLTGSNFDGSAAITWAVDATSANTASKVVARDASGNFSAGTITASLSGNATSASKVNNVLTRGNYLTGSNFDGSAATTWAVDATSTNTVGKVVARDVNGDFSAGTITATLSGNASSATQLQTARNINGVSFNGTSDITISGLATTPIAIGASQDLNNFKTAGFYSQSANANAGTGATLPGSGTAGANYPEASAGALHVIASAGVTQVYYVYNSSKVYTRGQYSAGAWTPWALQYNSVVGVNASMINSGTISTARIPASTDGDRWDKVSTIRSDGYTFAGRYMHFYNTATSSAETYKIDNPATGRLTFSGTVEVPVGTSTSPSFTFVGDTDTGIASPSANRLDFVTGGTLGATIDASGNTNLYGRLGVGTGSPSSAYGINSIIANANNNSTLYGAYLRADNGSTGTVLTANRIYYGTYTESNALITKADTSTFYVSSAGLGALGKDYVSTSTPVATDVRMIYGVRGYAVARTTDATITAQSLYGVNGLATHQAESLNAKLYGGYFEANSSATGSGTISEAYGVNSYINMDAKTSTNPSVIDTGYLFYGRYDTPATTSVTNKWGLFIAGTDVKSKVEGTMEATGGFIGNASTATKLATARTINGVSFDGTANITIAAVDQTARDSATAAQTTANNAMPKAGGTFTGRIDCGKNYISTSESYSFASQLTGDSTGITVNRGLAGNEFIAAAKVKSYATGGYSMASSFGTLRSGGANEWGTTVIHSVGDNGSSQMWGFAHVNGDFSSPGNVTAYSDIRLKTDIEVIPNAIDKIKLIRGVTYTRKDTGARQTGVIAQEVRSVLPEVVIEQNNDDKTLAVAYGNMVGLLIEGIKEQQKQIEELKIEIEKLKGNTK